MAYSLRVQIVMVGKLGLQDQATGSPVAYSQTGSKGRYRILSLLFPNSVWYPAPAPRTWNGATHIHGGAFLLSQTFLEILWKAHAEVPRLTFPR